MHHNLTDDEAEYRQSREMPVFSPTASLLLLLAALFSAGTSSAEDASSAALRLACAGDSNTIKGYPAILQSMLGDDWTVDAYATGAATVLDGTLQPYRRSDEYRSLLASSPDVVIIMLGANDARHQYWDLNGTPAHEFKQGYLELIRELQELDSMPEILVATPPPIYPGRAAEGRWELARIRDNLTDGVIPLIREVAAEAEGATLVDVYGHMSASGGSSSLSLDGIHYNSAGYRKMCGVFEAALIAD
ncbi:hypothetical protein THAOC_17060 [Thalassiosira oceanica]|uniref:SGNH hydrolase-type esterase domain-containing protein n=1 Tax=Thalassiosira oceanica TaxID=159749 RepID=K0SN10_THAOC|nr:hypothetical protein THAOC_17060 [Thalassiosira oceanica]|eukprot:EJK62331.1 hypothetical protein THAOC_17060 [Thalassiosira oceanica]